MALKDRLKSLVGGKTDQPQAPTIDAKIAAALFVRPPIVGRGGLWPQVGYKVANEGPDSPSAPTVSRRPLWV
jgi:hypothetical protein